MQQLRCDELSFILEVGEFIALYLCSRAEDPEQFGIFFMMDIFSELSILSLRICNCVILYSNETSDGSLVIKQETQASKLQNTEIPA